MSSTAGILRRAAHLITHRGLHTGDQFIDRSTNSADVAAAIFVAAEVVVPREFYTDEVTSLEIIAASAPAMTAIRALSDSLDTDACVTEIVPGHDVPDYIEHVCNWAATTPVFGTRPPSTSEVIGAILRAAQAADALTAVPVQRSELCETCGGHGSLVSDIEIPYEELSPRQRQGVAHGRKYTRSIPCPHCDGYDHATPLAEAQAEAA
ncbi:hypothetical protein [Streptomyces sp. NBC_01238]|uniref:DUF6197 family protein n=1 Tax=Streptomyces sp. NBC_01238 TaxID=2903791 RepID=UPI002F914125